MNSIKQLRYKLLKSTGKEQLKNIIAITLILVCVLTAGGLWLKYMPVFGIKGQSSAYNEIAQNLTSGRGFVWNDGSSANETPGYPYYLAVIYSIVDNNYTAVKIIQLLLLGLIGVFVFLICKRLSLKFIFSLLAGLATVLWPYFLLYSNLILPEIPLALFLIISTYLLLLFQKTPTYLKSISLGIILGLATLTRPMVLLLPFLITAGIIIFIKKLRKPKSLLKILTLLIFFIITLTPWTIRNYREFNELTPVQSEISGMIETDKTPPTTQEQTILNQNKTSYLKNIYLFWNPGAAGKQAKIVTDMYPKAKYLIFIYKIIFFCILALAMFSWKFLKQKKILLLWLCIAYFWAGYVFIRPFPRYTLPVIPIVIILGFFTLHCLLLKLTKK